MKRGNLNPIMVECDECAASVPWYEACRWEWEKTHKLAKFCAGCCPSCYGGKGRHSW